MISISVQVSDDSFYLSKKKKKNKNNNNNKNNHFKHLYKCFCYSTFFDLILLPSLIFLNENFYPDLIELCFHRIE